jgi:hypothetical protein
MLDNRRRLIRSVGQGGQERRSRRVRSQAKAGAYCDEDGKYDDCNQPRAMSENERGPFHL